jgi:hypothetical protein
MHRRADACADGIGLADAAGGHRGRAHPGGIHEKLASILFHAFSYAVCCVFFDAYPMAGNGQNENREYDTITRPS